jgi:hypothetical protein
VFVVRIPVVPSAIDEVYGILNVLVLRAVTGLATKIPVLEFITSPAVLVVRVPVVPNAIDEVYGILNVLVLRAVTGLAIKSPVLEFTVNASPIVLVVSVPVEPNTSDEVYGTLTVPVLRDTPTADNKLRAPLLALLTKFPFVPIPIYIPLSA